MKGRRSHLWTPEEDAALREMVAQGLHPLRIAIRLRRSRSGIMGRVSRLRLQLRTISRRSKAAP
jgi:hypothetical protein